MLLWLVAFYALNGVVRSLDSVSQRPFYPPVRALAASCSLLPNGWILSNGHCKRFFTLCVDGKSRQMDCYKVAKAAQPNTFVSPAVWVFNEAVKRCTWSSRCRGDDVKTQITAAIPLGSPTTVNPLNLPAKCVPGVSYAVGPCSNTFLRCNRDGILQSRACPSTYLFDPDVRTCLRTVPDCISSSRTTLRMLEDVERAWDEDRNAHAVRTKSEKVQRDSFERAAAPFERVRLFPKGFQMAQNMYHSFPHPWHLRARDYMANFYGFAPAYFYKGQHNIFDAFEHH